MNNYGFNREQRSKFNYWFAHWCAFQMVALCLHIWKPKYLFHDIEKPWLRLFLPYKKVQKIHRKFNRHHEQWLERHNHIPVDIDALIIDNECSRFTKQAATLTALQYFNKKLSECEQKISNQQADQLVYKYQALYNSAINRAKQLGLDE